MHRRFSCVSSLSWSSQALNRPRRCQPTINPDFLARHDDLATRKLPAPDYLDGVLECNAPRVGQLDRLPSNWIDAERAAYSSVLAKAKPQILVVPFQVQGYALDRIERALMSIDLTYQLGAALDVPDPTLVARAAVEGSRRIDPAAILELAHRVHVRKVIVPFVGHDNSHVMTITIQVLDVEATNTGMRVFQNAGSGVDVISRPAIATRKKRNPSCNQEGARVAEE